MLTRKNNLNTKGKVYEDKAVAYFLNRDYQIIARNFSYRHGEIDIIALKNKVLHLVEVKGGKETWGDPAFRVNSKKLKKIMKTGNYFIATHKNIEFDEIQIDVISVTNDGVINYYPAQRL
jgi:putative endonuclease